MPLATRQFNFLQMAQICAEQSVPIHCIRVICVPIKSHLPLTIFGASLMVLPAESLLKAGHWRFTSFSASLRFAALPSVALSSGMK